jgi:hypothetical protein
MSGCGFANPTHPTRLCTYSRILSVHHRDFRDRLARLGSTKPRRTNVRYRVKTLSLVVIIVRLYMKNRIRMVNDTSAAL